MANKNVEAWKKNGVFLSEILPFEYHFEWGSFDLTDSHNANKELRLSSVKRERTETIVLLPVLPTVTVRPTSSLLSLAHQARERR